MNITLKYNGTRYSRKKKQKFEKRLMVKGQNRKPYLIWEISLDVPPDFEFGFGFEFDFRLGFGFGFGLGFKIFILVEV